MIYESPQIQVKLLEHDIAHLIFNSEGSVNKLDQASLSALNLALDTIIEAQPRGVLLSSEKSAFIVGADITEFLELFSQSKTVLMGWLEQANSIFNKLENLPMPTISAINGFALGGGCETVLACDYRIADTTASIGLPETKLGLIPGFGGTVRLPRLIGAENAMEWMTTGRHYKAQDAMQVGVIDAIVDPDVLLPQALLMLEQAIEGQFDWKARREEKQSPLTLNETESQMAFTTAKAMLSQSVSSHYPAPFAVISVLEQAATLDSQSAQPIEQQSFIELAKSPSARALIQTFLNDQQVKSKAKKLAKQGQDYQQAAVLGAGIMGGGIAYQSASRGVPIVMKDISKPALDLGIEQSSRLMLKKVEKKRLQPKKMVETLNIITPTLDYHSLRNTDIVIEAVVEHPQVKAEVLTETEKHIAKDSILTSNTSTISINALAKNLQDPSRFCGMHFFNPVPKMPLVEVIQGQHTSDKTIATVCAYAQKMGKTPIVVQDCAGFFVNRVLFPYFYGFNQLLAEGADFLQIDKVMEQNFGWPMGPAHLLDVVGLDTAHHAQEIMAKAYPNRMALQGKNAISILYKEDRLGQKSRFGFYQYNPHKRGYLEKSADPSAIALLADQLGESGKFSEEDIIARCMLPMILEAVRTLDEGIIASPAEADMALLYGLGFPTYQGGAFHYINQMGTKKFVELADKFQSLGPAYQVPESLRQLASCNNKYQ